MDGETPGQTDEIKLVREIEPRDSRHRRNHAVAGSMELGAISGICLASVSPAGSKADDSDRARSVAYTRCSASTSKCLRSASRVSLRPNPSVPSVTNFPGTHCRICSGAQAIGPDQHLETFRRKFERATIVAPEEVSVAIVTMNSTVYLDDMDFDVTDSYTLCIRMMPIFSQTGCRS